MAIDLTRLSPEDQKILSNLMNSRTTYEQGGIDNEPPSGVYAGVAAPPAAEEQLDLPLAGQSAPETIEPVDPQESRAELDQMIARLCDASSVGAKREVSADIPMPTSRHGIALEAVLSELTRVTRQYPELRTFLARAIQTAQEGLNGPGTRVVTSG